MKNLNISRKNKYAIVQMNRGKVNALNHEMVTEIRDVFKELEADDEIQGVILTGIPHFFSAGLDVIELYDYDAEKIRAFMISFGMMHVELVQFTKPFICAINGHSPAGGTVIAIAADYRIMAEGEKYTIGLNEMAVNIQISHNIIDGYVYWIGQNLARRYIMDGKLLNVTEAAACGLVDEVVPADNLLDRAERKMKQYLMASPDIFRNTKYKLRKEWLDGISKYSATDLEQALEVWWKPEIRFRMKAFVDHLSKK